MTTRVDRPPPANGERRPGKALDPCLTGSQLRRARCRIESESLDRLAPFNLDQIRESSLASIIWIDAILLYLEAQTPGLSTAPKLAVGDGSLGFWIALQGVWGATEPRMALRRSVLWTVPSSRV
jgi:hypothetical protein